MDTPTNDHRRRLLQAMGVVAGAHGVAGVTIADLVREAGVSKRTFYEHFTSKEDCFLSLYRAVSHVALEELKAAVTSDRPWEEQLEQALSAYLNHLSGSPELLRTLFVEVQHLGEAGAKARRAVMQEVSEFLLATVHGGKGAADLDASLALAAVGGINELILLAVEQGRAAELPMLTSQAGEVVRRLTRRAQ
ncbi:MAG: TetR/AcrR family transcriptional regulator [Hydrogenophaga sp.]|nr:TetR/AcrR family transcriptional regulator [Hydrogenophaga sp.]